MHSHYSPPDSATAPLGLLPTPTAEEVAGFARLYERKYGARLDSDQARRQLSGLMRFLYLTRTASPGPVPTATPGAAGAAAPDGARPD